MGQLRPFEWIAVAYFVYLIVTSAAVPRVPAAARAVAIALASLIVGALGTLATFRQSWVQDVRLWLPLVYLPVAYWLPAQLVAGENPAFERWLLLFDHKCFGRDGLTAFRRRMPAPVIAALELAYLTCYPLVPLGFLTIAVAGYASLDGDRFWVAVLGAALPCYGVLPWLPSRPPRALETAGEMSGASIRNLNTTVLDRVSVGWNTFPSGHAAASIATALAVGVRLPLAGAIFAGVAAGIFIGSVVGRYHYAADAIAGALVAVLAFAASVMLG